MRREQIVREERNDPVASLINIMKSEFDRERKHRNTQL